MIPVIELVASLRYELGDMNGLNISDCEIFDAINRAVGLLYGALSESFVQVALKRLPIEIDSTKMYSLPSDFVRVHQLVFGNPEIMKPSSLNPPEKVSYRVVGRELFADEGSYTLEYYYQPYRIRELDDLLDVPEAMRMWVEQVALALYRKDSPKAEYLVQRCESTFASREVSHFEDSGPAQVLGGTV